MEIKLLEKRELLKLSTSKCNQGFVYFLFKESIIVYIGSTTNLSGRLAIHEKEKDYNNYAYIICATNKRKIIESLYILKFNPIYNNGKLSVNKDNILWDKKAQIYKYISKNDAF